MQQDKVKEVLVKHLKENGETESDAGELADKIIVATGAKKPGQLIHLKVEMLTDEKVGMGLIPAQELVEDMQREFGEKKEPTPAAAEAVSQQQPVQPTRFVLETGNLEDKPLRDLFQMVADGDKTPDLRRALAEKTRGIKCYVREDGSDKLDVAMTIEAYEVVSEHGYREFIAGRPIEGLDEVMEKRREADPLSGELLVNGIAPDGLDWKGVSDEHKLLAAYARVCRMEASNADRYVAALVSN